MLTGHASIQAAKEINRLGGYDYLLKLCPLEELLLKIGAAFEKKRERKKLKVGRCINAQARPLCYQE